MDDKMRKCIETIEEWLSEGKKLYDREMISQLFEILGSADAENVRAVELLLTEFDDEPGDRNALDALLCYGWA